MCGVCSHTLVSVEAFSHIHSVELLFFWCVAHDFIRFSLKAIQSLVRWRFTEMFCVYNGTYFFSFFSGAEIEYISWSVYVFSFPIYYCVFRRIIVIFEFSARYPSRYPSRYALQYTDSLANKSLFGAETGKQLCRWYSLCRGFSCPRPHSWGVWYNLLLTMSCVHLVCNDVYAVKNRKKRVCIQTSHSCYASHARQNSYLLTHKKHFGSNSFSVNDF